MIRKLFRLALCLAALAAMAWACEKSEPYDANTSVVVRSAELETAGGNAFVAVTCNGDWSLSLEFSDGGNWATVTPTSGSGSKNSIQLSYQANEGTDSRSLTLVLKPSNGAEARSTVYQEGIAPVQAYGYDVAPMNWLELPATAAGDVNGDSVGHGAPVFGRCNDAGHRFDILSEGCREAHSQQRCKQDDMTQASLSHFI